jgi:hypothetical protein
MQPSAPFPPPEPSGGGESADRTALALADQLERQGISRVYTASSGRYAVVSVNTGMTVWTNGPLIWCTVQGRRYTWAADEIGAAATRIVSLAGAA